VGTAEAAGGRPRLPGRRRGRPRGKVGSYPGKVTEPTLEASAMGILAGPRSCHRQPTRGLVLQGLLAAVLTVAVAIPASLPAQASRDDSEVASARSVVLLEVSSRRLLPVQPRLGGNPWPVLAPPDSVSLPKTHATEESPVP
jgi:hypothetical protein